MGLPNVHPAVLDAMRCSLIDERHLFRLHVVFTMEWKGGDKMHFHDMYMATQGMYRIDTFHKLDEEFSTSFLMHPKDQLLFCLGNRRRVIKSWPWKRAKQDDELLVYVKPWAWRHLDRCKFPNRKEVFLKFW